ncbi:MAG: xanthine dehydrogenase family protein molybdopterin-binding subunit, partial [Terriglobales bacterium]
MAAKAKANARWVGRRYKRKEDPRLIQGISHYTDDLKLPGLLHCVFVRSPYANARITGINADAARTAPGVAAVITGDDLKGVGSVPCAGALPDLKVPAHPALAQGHVRYVGEPVAAVVADDIYAARDAADLVEVSYDPLPVVVDTEKALEKGSPFVHEQFKTNLAFTHEFKNGDVEGAFQRADVIVKERLLNQRLAPIAMEGRSVMAEYKPGENVMTLWSATQIPHLLKTQVSVMLGVPETSMRVIAPEVGGGFGSKLNVYGEEGLVPYLAMRLGRPIKWVETRRENM